MSKVVEAAISIGPWFNSNIFALTYGEKGSDVDVYGLTNDAIAGAHYCRYISSVTLAVQPCARTSEDFELQYKNGESLNKKGWFNIFSSGPTGSHSADTQGCISEETPVILAYQLKDICSSNLFTTMKKDKVTNIPTDHLYTSNMGDDHVVSPMGEHHTHTEL
jgi:hypothetical protein